MRRLVLFVCVCLCASCWKWPLQYILVTDECLPGQYQSQGFHQLSSHVAAQLGSRDGAIWVYLDL